MEVANNDLTAAGIQWPSQIGVGLQGAAGVPGSLTGTEATHFGSGLVRLTVPDPMLVFRLNQQVGRTNILANPRIRAKSREKARIHIGDKVPVITTTAGATGFVSESINYLEVGLKLEVEPQVYLDNDVGIKVGLEVSNVGAQTKTSSGTIAYTVGTRNTATTLRLRDGETQILAGLISDEDRRSASQVPGMSNLPLLGRLFKTCAARCARSARRSTATSARPTKARSSALPTSPAIRRRSPRSQTAWPISAPGKRSISCVACRAIRSARANGACAATRARRARRN